MIIKGLLKEELKNSLKMKIGYNRELKKLPKGSLVKKKIKGHDYYYIAYRDHGPIKFVYKGKAVPQEVIDRYERAKELRKKYRNLLSKAKKQVRYLRGVTRGKEPI